MIETITTQLHEAQDIEREGGRWLHAYARDVAFLLGEIGRLEQTLQKAQQFIEGQNEQIEEAHLVLDKAGIVRRLAYQIPEVTAALTLASRIRKLMVEGEQNV